MNHALCIAAAAATLCTAATAAPKPGTPTPKVVAMDYARADFSTQHLDALAGFPLVIFNFTRSNTSSDASLPYHTVGSHYADTRGFLDALRQRNPDVTMIDYVNGMELYTPETATEDFYPIYAQVAANTAAGRHWWAIDDRTGAAGQWSPQPTGLVNLTTSAGPDPATGYRYPQAKAQFDWDYYLKSQPQLAGVFIDNVMEQAFSIGAVSAGQFKSYVPAVTADYLLAGADPALSTSASDPVNTALRAGQASYAQEQRARGAAVVVVNAVSNGLPATSELDAPEYAGAFDGGYMEGMMGAGYSWPANPGFTPDIYRDKMIRPYERLLRNLRGGQYAIFEIKGDPAKDFQNMRWGLASAMMGNGYFCFTSVGAAASQPPAWFDEYSVMVGAPVDLPQNKPQASGLWVRKYRYGLVLSNPTDAPLQIDLTGQGYYRINAAHFKNQQPAVNDGRLQGVVQVPARDGLILTNYPT